MAAPSHPVAAAKPQLSARMRRSIVTIVAAAVVAVTLAPAVAQAAPPAPAALAWSPSFQGSFDYGTVAVGQSVSQAFVLTNTGAGPPAR